MVAGARISHVIGVDDAPKGLSASGDDASTLVIATAYAGLRLEGVLSTHIARDGDDATEALQTLIAGSRFAQHLQAVLLQGITLAGFNVVDIGTLAEALRVPVLVVVRKPPDMGTIERALRTHVRNGERKWALVQRAGPVEPAGRVYIQRAGIEIDAAARLVERLAVHGHVPEPLRAAHLIAGGVVSGHSRGRT